MKIVIDHLNQQIGDDVYTERLCLAEKIQKGEQQFPAVRNGNDFDKIDLDKKDGIGYWRKIADVTLDKADSIYSCGISYTTSIPLRFVGFVKREKLPSPDQYTDDKLCQTIISRITTNSNLLRSALKAQKVEVLARSYTTDTEKIVREEYEEVQFKPRYAYSYIAIDVQLTITTSNNCIPGLC